MTDSRGSSVAWLGHPVTVTALVTLIVNDHLLKTEHPSWVTGKLSDAAGLVLAPALLAVLTRLGAPAAIAVVAVAFTTVKSFPYAAGLASAAWSSVAGPSLIRADLTDLLTLPALGLSWWAWRSASRRRLRAPGVRVARAESAPAAPVAPFGWVVPVGRIGSVARPGWVGLVVPVGLVARSGRVARVGRAGRVGLVARSGRFGWVARVVPVGWVARVRQVVSVGRVGPVPLAWVRAVRIGVLLPLALFAVAATGAVPRAVAARVAVEANTIYLGAHTERSWSWSLSLDQAVTWTPAGEDETAGFTTRFLLPVTRSCSVADPRICYRVMPDELGVQVSNDGGATWTTSWQADAAERKRVAREYSEPAFHNPELSSVSLGVHDVPGGHIVIVANGLDGFRQRDPDGTWRRIGMPALFGSGPAVRPSVHDPATDQVDDTLRIVAVALLLGTAVICIGGALGARRQRRPYRWYIAMLLATATTLPPALFSGPDGFFAYAGPALSIGVSLLAGLVSLLAPAGLNGKGEWALRLLGAAILTTLIGAGCCLMWLTGVLPGWVAAPLCLAAVVPGALFAQRAAADLPSPARGP